MRYTIENTKSYTTEKLCEIRTQKIRYAEYLLRCGISPTNQTYITVRQAHIDLNTIIYQRKQKNT
jgi:hypothetical protein